MTTGTKKVLAAMIIITSLGLATAYFYYQWVNEAEDPRVLEARYMLKKFDKLIEDKDYFAVFPLLDKIEKIYLNTPGYEKSYEMGVVNNNRTAAYLLLALYETGEDEKKKKEHYLKSALECTQKSIEIYEDWIDLYGTLTEDELYSKIEGYFRTDSLKGQEIDRIISKRVDDLEMAQLETRRRLSVSYTNLGIIQRHQYRQKAAVKSYVKALELWPDNHTAKNNLNVLLGKPVEERSTIEKIFPKDRRNE